MTGGTDRFSELFQSEESLLVPSRICKQTERDTSVNA